MQLTISLLAYNEEKYIAEAIESILKQTYRDFAFRVYNHASTDSTGEIIDQFAKKDPRVQAIHLATNESGRVFNRLVQEVATPFFMFMAGHDIYHPNYVETCMTPLLREPGIVLSYSRAVFFRGDQVTGSIQGNFSTLGMDALSRSLVVGYGLVYAYQFYGIYRISALRQIPVCQVVGADHVLLAGLALFGTFSETPEVLLFMRQLVDFGDQDAYKKKHHLDRESAHTPFLKTTQAYMQLANRVRDDIDRDLMKLAYFTQTLIRNRNILDMYGSNIHGLFAAPEMRCIRLKLGELVEVIEAEFGTLNSDS